MALSLERRALFRVGVRFGGMETALCAGADPRSRIVAILCARVLAHTTVSDNGHNETHKLFIGLDLVSTHYTDRTEVRADVSGSNSISVVSLRNRGPSLNMLSNTTRDAIYPKVFRQPPISSSSTLCSAAAACSIIL